MSPQTITLAGATTNPDVTGPSRRVVISRGQDQYSVDTWDESGISALLWRFDPERVGERVPQPAVRAVEPLGRLLGEFDALGDELLLALLTFDLRFDGTNPRDRRAQPRVLELAALHEVIGRLAQFTVGLA